MSNRYAVEQNVADAVQAYLQEALAADATNSATVVTFVDLMEDEFGDRINVFVPDCIGSDEALGNFVVTVEIGIKTQPGEPGLAERLTTHMQRVAAVRASLMVEGLRELLDAAADTDVIGFNAVRPSQRYSTQVFAVTGFITRTEMEVQVFIKAP